jgi:uncharacterized protein (TIGR03118 family)
MRVRTTLAVGVSAAAGLALTMTPLAASAGSPGSAVAPMVTVHKLVSDQPGVAQMTDPDLVNAWGMSHPPGGPLWVSDNGADVSTLYTGAISGSPVQKAPLVVGTPGGAPTGQVFNSTNGFEVPGTGMPALFIFAGENGDITAWNGSSNTEAVQVVHEKNAVFKGIALMTTPAGPRLLVANFHAGRVEEYGSGFHLMRSMGFADSHLPDRYAPFNVAVFRHKVYVTYAKQDADAHDDVAGPGHGFIDVYSEQGQLLRRLVSRGALNSPWGLVTAPGNFGSISGQLLVGNFGDGLIHVYDRQNGDPLGTLTTPNGQPVHIDGLWGLLRGDTAAGGDGAIWFSAGPAGESHGLLGVLRAG